MSEREVERRDVLHVIEKMWRQSCSVTMGWDEEQSNEEEEEAAEEERKEV